MVSGSLCKIEYTLKEQAQNIPLSLYVHIPWCEEKCPYCDFNSHKKNGEIPQEVYVNEIISDFQSSISKIEDRELKSIFFGGGTPSLFSSYEIGRFLDHANKIVNFSDDIEISIEANPSSAEKKKFSEFKSVGFNRISIGIQSLEDSKLKSLGRIHGRKEALSAVTSAREAGFNNINLDLMYALPYQTTREAERDLREVIALMPDHISWYQLTLEPNTFFYQKPPNLPSNDEAGEMMDMGMDILSDNSFNQYEVSAFAKKNKECRHNLNYWTFGDYLGIGAGAHTKITQSDGRIERSIKKKNPKSYMAEIDKISSERTLVSEELAIEFMLNALRLKKGVKADLYEERTGQNIESIADKLNYARDENLLVSDIEILKPTTSGFRYLNNLLEIFEP